MIKDVVTDVFFDLDHTLWDFEKNSALTFEKIFLENNISANLDDFLNVYIPTNNAYWKLYREEKVTKEDLRYQRLKVTFDALGYSITDGVINLLADEYIGSLSSFNHIFEGAHDILTYLKPKYGLHIITNGFQEVQEKKLKNSDLYAYFDKVINSEMAGVKKPNPYIFKLALGLTKTQSHNALMIGDNLEADILGAQAAGFHVLHFNAHKESTHNYCDMIDNLGEIKSFL